MATLEFGFGENLKLSAGGEETWNAMARAAFQPRMLRGNFNGPIDDIDIVSLRIGVDEQLVDGRVPLRKVLDSSLPLPLVLPGLLVSVRLASRAASSLELAIWLEGDDA